MWQHAHEQRTVQQGYGQNHLAALHCCCMHLAKLSSLTSKHVTHADDADSIQAALAVTRHSARRVVCTADASRRRNLSIYQH